MFKQSVPFDMDSDDNVIIYGKPISGLHRRWRIERNGDVYAAISDDYEWFDEDLVNIAV